MPNAYTALSGGSAATNGGLGGGNFTGGSGGSGIVIIKVPDNITATFSGGVTSSLSTSGGFNIYSVTATSTTSETVTFARAILTDFLVIAGGAGGDANNKRCDKQADRQAFEWYANKFRYN